MSIFEPIRHERTFEEVALQIEALILEGVLRPGDQLPGERELANDMGVSRPVVRQAIELLKERNILQRKQGDGTFVGDVIGKVFASSVAEILPNHKKATQDYLEYRREVEGIAAGFAAERATQFDCQLLEDCMQRMQELHEEENFQEEAKCDLEFHALIGESAHNLILLHTLRSCYELLAQGIFQNRTKLYEKPGARQALFDQHMAIGKAILAGDREAAIHASQGHMSYVLDQSRQLDNEMERERIAGLRRLNRNA